LSEYAAALTRTGGKEPDTRTACDLCGLPAGPLGATETVEGRDYNFCCPGCRQVFLILSQSTGRLPGDFRESEIYKACVGMGIIPGSVTARETDLPLRPRSDGETLELSFRTTGMWCPACAWLIEEVLRKTPGIVKPRVSFLTDTARLTYQPHLVTPAEIFARVEKLGYKAGLSEARSSGKGGAARDLLKRLGISAILSMNAMMFSSYLYFGFVRDLSPTVKAYFSYPLLLLSAPVVFYAGMPILRKAWAGIRVRTVSMDTLVAVSALSAFFYSIVQMARGSIHVYFDTAAMLVTIVLLGRYIEFHARERVFEAVRAGLDEIGPGKARITTDGPERWMPVQQLKPGDRFSVRPGERVPLDGLITGGRGLLDQSVITGEPEPVPGGAGDHVMAGSLLTDGDLEISATRTSADSSLKQMADLVTEALDRKDSGEQLADSLSRFFVPVVMGIAVITAAEAWRSGLGADQVLLRCLTVLLIACPCALGIAAPMVKVAIVGLGRRNGIFVKNPRALERVPGLDTIVFDKTGTLTEGKFVLHDIVPASKGREEILPLITAVEARSSHFLAREILRHARETGLPLPEATGIEEFPGLGVTGDVGGRQVFAGNRLLLEKCGAQIPAHLEREAGTREKSAMTIVFFGWDSDVEGFLTFGDTVRPGAREVVKALQTRGLKVLLLSGDGEKTTGAIAGLLGITDFFGRKIPSEKASIIRELQGAGRKVGMVGDGINDSAALASADVAIALGASGGIARDASDLVISGGNLEKITDIFRLSRTSIRTTRQNLCFAFLYNATAIPVAAAGLLNPLLAVAAMFLSSLMVIGNAMRISRGGRI